MILGKRPYAISSYLECNSAIPYLNRFCDFGPHFHLMVVFGLWLRHSCRASLWQEPNI